MAAKKSIFPKPKDSPRDETVATRVYYRHSITGDRGYAVVEDGETRIKFDRINDPFTRRLDGNWQPETEHRPLLKHQLWRVAFEADKVLCAAIGLQSLSNREWLNLGDDGRIDWGRNGPVGNGLRQTLFRAIMKALEPESQ